MKFSTAIALLLVAISLAGCDGVTTRAPSDVAPLVPAEWSLPAPVEAVRGSRGMVVSGHPLASGVGAQILSRGGSAIDAAVAVGFALAVVLPEAGNLGGGGFLVYRDTNGTVRTLDFRETAPAAASRDMYLDAEGNPTDRSIVGHLAVGVPGSVAGLWEMHRELGALPWRDLLEPAIALAEGHAIDAVRSAHLAERADRLRRFAVTDAQFLVDGKAPPPGTVWRQSDLARTLEQIAAEGADAFYRGSIAELLVAEMERGGGIITGRDLAGYGPVWREPIEVAYRGSTIYTMPPPSSGGVALAELLNIMQGFDPLPPFGHADLVHLEAEAMRWAFLDRNRELGDPDFVDMPLARLLSKEYAASLRERILPARATPTPPLAPNGQAGAHTTHYSVVDGEGNAAAVTTTLNTSYGSGVTVRGAGFLLNNEMDDFAAAPGKPNYYGLVQGEANAIAPRKRMLSSMTPSIVVDAGGELELIVGSPGGGTIITTVYQVMSNVLDHGMSLAEAVAAPRIHHQALPDVIYYEPNGLGAEQLGRLKQMGYQVKLVEQLAPPGVKRSKFSGDVTAIRRADDGWVGVADTRRGSGAAGY